MDCWLLNVGCGHYSWSPAAEFRQRLLHLQLTFGQTSCLTGCTEEGSQKEAEEREEEAAGMTAQIGCLSTF
jgi:hypothetical protein